jgi:hypothetical protein
MLSAHPFWSLDVPRLDGQLLLTPCPGSQQVPMADALAQLQLAGAGGVLTLMTVEELALCGPLSLGQLVQARGMSWFHLPIADDEAPDAAFEQAWPGVQPRQNAWQTNTETGFSRIMRIPLRRGKHQTVPGFIFVSSIKFNHSSAVLRQL